MTFSAEQIERFLHAVEKIGAYCNNPPDGDAYAISQLTDALAPPTYLVDGAPSVGDTIAESFAKIAAGVRSDHPLQGETFDGITREIGRVADALNRVADAISDHGE